MATQKEPR
ncbi:unnamed protein product, partial [Rotaria sordida]